MNINIRGENLEVTGALREYVEKKLNRLERYLDIPPESDAHVTLRVQRDKQNVEVTIPLRGGAVLRAEVKHADMYASIDLVVDKLEGQIRKHKTKANRKFNKGGIRNLFIENNEKTSVTYSEEEDELEVVRTKSFIMKPMDVEEAILQMNLIGHTFFVFANMDDNNQINVVYKRDDGRYGLIETA